MRSNHATFDMNADRRLAPEASRADHTGGIQHEGNAQGINGAKRMQCTITNLNSVTRRLTGKWVGGGDPRRSGVVDDQIGIVQPSQNCRRVLFRGELELAPKLSQSGGTPSVSEVPEDIPARPILQIREIRLR
jgi:hypothetical protein